jgi:multiple sugar transport system substrate-binding protein
MRTLRLVALGMVCAAALALAGCGGGDGDGDGEAKTLDANAAEGAEGDVTWCIGKDTSGSFTQMVQLHNQQNNGVTARLVELPTSADQQRTQQIQRLRAESDECDILGIDVIWTAEYASQNWIYDLTNVIEDRQSEFIASTLESAKYQDKYWAVPFNSNAGFLYYRTDQVGDQAPATWQEVYREAQQEDGLVYQGARYEGLTVNFLELLFSAGGRVLSEDGESVEIDSPETRDVLEFMRSGIQDGAVPQAVTTYMEQETREAFESGTGSYMRNWPYAYALGNESDIKGKFDITPFPSWEGGEAAGILGGYNLAISAYSDAPEAALEFINFVTQPDAQKIMATKATLPPVTAQTYDDPAVQKVMPFATQLRDAIEQAGVRPVSPVYPQISEAIYTNVFAVLQGNSSPDQATKNMAQEIESALETF